jgi:hypothetical protein
MPNPAASRSYVAGVALLERDLQRTGPVTSARCEIAWLAGDRTGAAAVAARAWASVRAEDSPWGLVATWLRGDRAPLVPSPSAVAPPFALEVAERWLDAAQAWHALGCPYAEACPAAGRSRHCAAPWTVSRRSAHLRPPPGRSP